MAVKFGVFVPQGWRMDLVQIKDPIEKYEAMTRVAQAADRGPWDAIWVYDHFHTVPEPKLEATFECWTITSTLVRDTKRVRVGQMVGCNGYRNPALYAKIASTVDVASHGRLNAGIGAGWYEHEWRAYGYGFPELKERMGMFKEACEIIHRWVRRARHAQAGGAVWGRLQRRRRSRHDPPQARRAAGALRNGRTQSRRHHQVGGGRGAGDRQG
ncbi:MAG: LLM class flavin-dependent oxidoreductase [Chloroflexota bacterium]|nr:MAG: LLM class flavin-dependent oxidoreductase [Chloroflexota bacterium]